jgi:hypothetical protein
MRHLFYKFGFPMPVIVVLLLLPLQHLGATDFVTLNLRSHQDVYVLHEPVQFMGELKNSSGEIVRLQSMRDLADENMRYLFLEIITSEGEKQERRTCFGFIDYVAFPEYKGEPLLPGESYDFDIFPNHTYSIRQEDMMKGGWTFPEAGEYKVRLVYEVESFREHLWKPPGNRLYSNQITIRVVEPMPAQKEILAAYWKDSVSGGMTWDGKFMSGFDVKELNRVVQKYPNDAFIKYPLFALLNTESSMAVPDLSQVAPHAKYLMSHFPDFRPGPVRRLYAAALIESGRQKEGLKVLDEALAIDPRLKDNFDIMMLKVGTERGSERAFWQWVRERDLTP